MTIKQENMNLNLKNSFIMNICTRISSVCVSKKIKAAYLHKNNVAAKQTVYDVLNEKQNPNMDFVTNFLNLFPDVNGDWLVTGRGEMYSKGYTNYEANKNKESNISIGDGSMVMREPEVRYCNNNDALLEAKDNEIRSLRETIEAQKETILLLKQQLK